MTTGEKIKEIREKYLQITEETLAQRINELFSSSLSRLRNQQYISNIECRREPTVIEVKQIAKALGVRWSDLINPTDFDPLLIDRLKKNPIKSTI